MQQGLAVWATAKQQKEIIVHYYMFNIGDYASHTQRLSVPEDCAYRRLLDLYYLNERPFNGCSTDVAREIGMSDSLDSVEYILQKFFPNDGECWRNKRADKEIARYQSKKKLASKAGKASGKARRGAASEQTLNGRSSNVEPTINQEPLTNNQELITTNHKPLKTPPSNPDGFDEFWFNYPKKVGKPEALKAWKKLKPSAELTNQLITDIQNRVNQGAWCTGQGKQYIPGPAPYLNQRKWEDEIIPRPEFKAPVDYAAIGRSAVEL